MRKFVHVSLTARKVKQPNLLRKMQTQSHKGNRHIVDYNS